MNAEAPTVQPASATTVQGGRWAPLTTEQILTPEVQERIRAIVREELARATSFPPDHVAR